MLGTQHRLHHQKQDKSSYPGLARQKIDPTYGEGMTNTLKFQIVRKSATDKLSFEGTLADFIEFAKQNGHEHYDGPFDYPQLNGLLGPMVDGGFVRYEDPETYRLRSL